MAEPTKKYGFRDLGCIQDFRRTYLESKFSFGTNDLGLALRIYSLRQESGTDAILATELGRVFTNIVSGKVEAAQLSQLESKPGDKFKNNQIP